jgi:hypothetical protein
MAGDIDTFSKSTASRTSQITLSEERDSGKISGYNKGKVRFCWEEAGYENGKAK